MSAPVDVLAVLGGAVEGYEAALPRLRGKQRDECEDGLSDLKEARAAVTELIEAAEAARKTERFDSNVESWAHYSLRFRASRDRLRDALVRVKGEQP